MITARMRLRRKNDPKNTRAMKNIYAIAAWSPSEKLYIMPVHPSRVMMVSIVSIDAGKLSNV